MTTNRIKRMLAEQSETVEAENRESRNGTFEVHANHPAFSHTCCEMCGGAVDRNHDAIVQHEPPADVDVRKVLFYFMSLALKASQNGDNQSMVTLQVINHVLQNGWHGVRVLAARLGMEKSQAQVHVARITKNIPTLAPILGRCSGKTLAQQTRRERERHGTDNK